MSPSQRENEIAAFRTLARADLALEDAVENAINFVMQLMRHANVGEAGTVGGGFMWGAFSHGGLMGERTPELIMPLPKLGKRPKA